MSDPYMMTKDQIVDAVRRLSPPDRADVITTLNESFADESPGFVDLEAEGFTPEVIAEFDRRFQEMQDDPSKAIDGDQFLAELDRMIEEGAK